MSETEYGTRWPPTPDDSEEVGSEGGPSPATASIEDESDDTPDRYDPDHLADYKVCGTSHDGLSVTLGTPALLGLYAVPGDRVRVYDHPAGILVTHADLDPSHSPELLPIGDLEDEPDDDPETSNRDVLSHRSAIHGDGFIADDDASDHFYASDYAPSSGHWPVESSTDESETTDFSECVHYSCRHCNQQCINKIESDPARMKQCRDCFDEESMHFLDPITHHLPEEV